MPANLECTPRCRSKQHILELISAVTKGTFAQVKIYIQRCHNATKHTDSFGRTLLHIAATCGKADIIEWLLEERKMKPTIRDLESSWTALHRAMFYGQLAAARVLVSHVSPGLYLTDKEGLSPLDLVMKDRHPCLDFSDVDLCETYSWGDNSNFTLGHSNNQRKPYPEMIDTFRREKINITQVVLCKFHTVFLTRSGRVYTCGHGQGGRLGHSTEQTCVEPRLVESLRHEKIRAITAGVDHTLFLTESNVVYACGMNDARVLGMHPAPDRLLCPKQLKTRVFKETIVGVCAGRFHSVFYTATAVYSCGLNAGQLGYRKGDPFQVIPRQVSGLNHKDIKMEKVVCSDAATVCLTTKGHIFVLHEYQCRKIASRWSDVRKICVSGGNLDHKTDIEILREKGGKELVIVILIQALKLFIWRASTQTLQRICWSLGRELDIWDVALNPVNIAVITRDGEAFLTRPNPHPARSQTPVKANTAKELQNDKFGVTTLLDLLEKEDIVEYDVERVPCIHWGLRIASDKKGRNFVVMQGQPNANLTRIPEVQSSQMLHHFTVLLDEADEFDTIHDVILQLGPRRIPAHKYILAYRSEHFRKLFLEADLTNSDPLHQVIDIPNVNVELFTQMLQFIYTDDCDLLQLGKAYTLSGEAEQNDADDFILVQPTKRMSAYEYQQQKPKPTGWRSNNPVKHLQELAKMFGVKSLIKRLDAVRYIQGRIQSNGKFLAKPEVRFDRRKLTALSDISLQSDDGQTIPCHKCILCGRLEYFHSMLSSSWIETSNSEPLALPIPSDILKVVVEYIYTDTAQIVASEDTEFICNVLVVADQLLISRLKDMCEASLTTLLTLKNAAELLEFSTIYNSEQLKVACQQYISINLAAMVESRYLDVLSDDVMEELTKYYKNSVPNMQRRIVTPYSDPPDRALLESLELEAEEEDNQLTSQIAKEGSTKKGKTKRRKSKTKTTDGRDRRMSVNSDVSVEEFSSEPTSPRSDVELFKALHLDLDSLELTDLPSPPEVSSPKSPFAWTATVDEPSAPVGAWRHSVLPDITTPSPASRSLKDIMIEEEAQESGRRQNVTASGKKLSKKERRKQLFRPISLDKPEDDSKTMEEEKPRKPAAVSGVCPWSNASNMVQSFRDLMLDDEKQAAAGKKPEKQPTAGRPPTPSSGMKPTPSSGMKPPTPSAGVKPTTPSSGIRPPTPSSGGDASFVWGLPTSKVQQKHHKEAVKSPESPSPPSQPCSPRENPWNTKGTDKVVSFSEIVKDEIEQKQTLDEASNKPLHLIQIEEQAIQELLSHYKSDDNYDKFITVERVTKVMASPTWVALQQPRN